MISLGPDSPFMTVLPFLVDDTESDILVGRSGGKDEQAGIGIALVPDETI